MTTTTDRRTPRRAHRAFTLLEMMLVLLIIGLLATVAALNLVGGAETRAPARATETTIHTIETALKSYNFETGAYPTTEQGLAVLVPKFIEKPPLDGWKRPLFYYSPGTHGFDFEIVSYGKDALPDTEDDVRSWELE